MANIPIRNPFSPLEVRTDDEEDSEIQQKKNTNSAQEFILTGPTSGVKRKKKIRPEEKKRLEEEKLKNTKIENEKVNIEKTEKTEIIAEYPYEQEFNEYDQNNYYNTQNNYNYNYDKNYKYNYDNNKRYGGYNKKNYYSNNYYNNKDTTNQNYAVQEKELDTDKNVQVEEEINDCKKLFSFNLNYFK